jgi:glycosyltransferase involved in cell wall biosynthesis
MGPMDETRISVIVPSYNRAVLLGRTLPTYLQPEVGELILIDDCSTDDTYAVVDGLAAKYGRIRYIRSERNLKQTHAKNLGIAAAHLPFVYFGDDDSLLLAGSMARLLATMAELDADIVGARAPYMETEEDEANPETFANRCSRLDGPLVEARSLRTRFDRITDGPIEAPFVHAAFLTRRDLAAMIMFDESYTGSCYREETDFLVRAKASGAKIVYESRAVQANLPRFRAGGGAHGEPDNAGQVKAFPFISRKLRYFADVLDNNHRFLKKNNHNLQTIFGFRYPIVFRQAALIWDIIKVIAEYPIRKLRNDGR